MSKKNGLNKTELTTLLARRAYIPKTKAGKYVEIVLDLISESLVEGKKVVISDFGTFSVSYRKSFEGHNPKTGESVTVPARTIPMFKAGKRLKALLNSEDSNGDD